MTSPGAVEAGLGSGEVSQRGDSDFGGDVDYGFVLFVL